MHNINIYIHTQQHLFLYLFILKIVSAHAYLQFQSTGFILVFPFTCLQQFSPTVRNLGHSLNQFPYWVSPTVGNPYSVATARHLTQTPAQPSWALTPCLRPPTPPLPPTWMCFSPHQALTPSQAPLWTPCPTPLGMPFSPCDSTSRCLATLVRCSLHPLRVQSALLSSTLHGRPPYLDQAAILLRCSCFSAAAPTLGQPICPYD